MSLSTYEPFEPGTVTLVAVSDGTEFSYCHNGKPRSPVPGEHVKMRWHPRSALYGDGIVVSVVDRGDDWGPEITVLWAQTPIQQMYTY